MTRKRFLKPALTCLAVILAGLGITQATRAVRGSNAGIPALDPAKIIPVRRSTMEMTLRAGGELNSAKNTLIECELESFSVYSSGARSSSDGTSVITSVIPQGTLVKKGDVLCTLDASEYEEMYRQQKLKVESARADRLRAELDLEVSEISKKEYIEGIAITTRKNYLGQIELAESDVGRARDRVEWTGRMLGKGYVSKSQMISEELNLKRLEFQREKVLTAFNLFEDFTFPRAVKQYDTTILARQTVLSVENQRLASHEERLKRLEKQIANCTIKAPHEGMVIYADEDNPDRALVEGLRVRPQQDLFILPNMSLMEVEARINETMIDRVSVGMPAIVKVEARPEKSYMAEIVEVENFPTFDSNRRYGVRVNNYVAHIRLVGTQVDLMPGMSAEVEIVTGHCEDALIVPTNALWRGEGRTVCYVSKGGGIEARAVHVGHSTSEWAEVVDGLDEGEEIVGDTSLLDEATVAMARTIPMPQEAEIAPEGEAVAAR